MIEDDRVLAHALGMLEPQIAEENGRLKALDLASLQVALMVAALDGEILPREYETFNRLANRCDGATPEKVARAFDEALHSAGYFLLQSARLREDELASLFADEAVRLLSSMVYVGSPERLRAAFSMWVAMAMSDGDFSSIERACIRVLFQRMREQVADESRRSLEESQFRTHAYFSDESMQERVRSRIEEMLPSDFLEDLEQQIGRQVRRSSMALSLLSNRGQAR